MRAALLLAAVVSAAAARAVPCVELSNAADAGVCMPIVGSGSGGYVGNASAYPYGAYP